MRRLSQLGLGPSLWDQSGRPGVTDNGNHILDCATDQITDAMRLEGDIRAIPGVVGTGLFLGMAGIVLVGDRDFQLTREERQP